MIDLNWVEVTDGFESGSYRIEPLREHPRYHWRLLISAASDALRGPQVPSMPTSHATLRGARAQAIRLERHRIRRMKIVRHLVVGTAASLLSLMLAPYVASLLSFCLAVGLIAVAVRSFVTAAVLAIGDAWGLADGKSTDRETRLDAVVFAAVSRMRPPQTVEESVVPKVRVLPPLPPD